MVTRAVLYPKGGAVPGWAKNLTLITGLAGWSGTVIVMLFRGQIPDLGTLGVPAALILALAPPIRIGRSGADETQPETAAADQEASA